LVLLALTACNGDSQDENPEPETPTNSYGSYLYNGVEKNIGDAVFGLSESSDLLLIMTDEDGRKLKINITDYDGEGYYEKPTLEAPFLSGGLRFNHMGELRRYVLQYPDTSSVTILDSSSDFISGSFDLRYVDPETQNQANCMEGQFVDVPLFELLPATVGQDFISGYYVWTIDSIHTRITNTFFVETYVYASDDLGAAQERLFRFDVLPLSFSESGRAFYGYTDTPSLNWNYETEVSFDGTLINTTELEDEHWISIRFEDLPIDELPKPYGSDGELLLYRADEIISFDEVSLNLEWGADPVLVASNQAGNVLIVQMPVGVSNPTGLETNAGRPGVVLEILFFTSENDVEPQWTSSGFMHDEYVAEGIRNIGFETYYLAPDNVVPTFLRMKNYSL